MVVGCSIAEEDVLCYSVSQKSNENTGASRDISIFRKHNKHACIPSPHLSSSLFSLPSCSLCLFLVLSCFAFSFSIPPSPSLLPSPHLALVLASSSSSSTARVLFSPPVCAQRAWEKMGHKQHGKQTTCFLLRSRVVKCVDGNRNGQPCSRIRIARMDSGRGGKKAVIHVEAKHGDAWGHMGMGRRLVIDELISRLTGN